MESFQGLISRRNAAKFLGLHISTVDKLICGPGGLQSVRVGRRCLIVKEGLGAFVKRNVK